MNEIFDLYQELIIDHSRSPKNFGTLANKSHDAKGHNPLCGDIIQLDVMVKDGVIFDIAFSGDGCAISKASASLMTESIKGKAIDQALLLFNSFHQMLVTEEEPLGLEKLLALKGVRQFPMRVKCATLCWHTLSAALKEPSSLVSTE